MFTSIVGDTGRADDHVVDGDSRMACAGAGGGGGGGPPDGSSGVCDDGDGDDGDGRDSNCPTTVTNNTHT